MDSANQRLETGYEPIHVDVWRTNLRLSDGAPFTQNSLQTLAIELFDININSDVFYAWVTQVFIPVLPKNSVIIMDNATISQETEYSTSHNR